MAKFVTFVLPCLNEAQSIGKVVKRIKDTFDKFKIDGEVIVSDNGSTDGSQEIAKKFGAKVFKAEKRGYGNAYLNIFVDNIDKVKDGYIFMADSDNTYEYEAIPRFIEKLDEGYDLVIGDRFKLMEKGAMPFLNKYVGNPILRGLFNILFHSNIRDTHCGMRAFTKEALIKLKLKCGGMEFASEMMLKALREKLKIAQVDIKYSPRIGDSKLNPFNDGWRHLKFMLLYAPNYLFLAPGSIMALVGLTYIIILSLGPIITEGNLHFGIHQMILGSSLAIVGYQILMIWLFAHAYALKHIFEDENSTVKKIIEFFTLEKGLILGIILFLIGFIIDIRISYLWIINGFKNLNQIHPAILALTLIVIGIQTIFASFFLNTIVVGIEKKD